MNSSNFTNHPFSSILNECESETVAANIMRILQRTGDRWRLLRWEEYERERKKDGNFSIEEKPYFDDVISFCLSPERAQAFCRNWVV